MFCTGQSVEKARASGSISIDINRGRVMIRGVDALLEARQTRHVSYSQLGKRRQSHHGRRILSLPPSSHPQHHGHLHSSFSVNTVSLIRIKSPPPTCRAHSNTPNTYSINPPTPRFYVSSNRESQDPRSVTSPAFTPRSATPAPMSSLVTFYIVTRGVWYNDNLLQPCSASVMVFTLCRSNSAADLIALHRPLRGGRRRYWRD